MDKIKLEKKLTKEFIQIHVKIQKLKKFMNSEEFQRLSISDQRLLSIQDACMAGYANALSERADRLENTMSVSEIKQFYKEMGADE